MRFRLLVALGLVAFVAGCGSGGGEDRHAKQAVSSQFIDPEPGLTLEYDQPVLIGFGNKMNPSTLLVSGNIVYSPLVDSNSMWSASWNQDFSEVTLLPTTAWQGNSGEVFGFACYAADPDIVFRNAADGTASYYTGSWTYDVDPKFEILPEDSNGTLFEPFQSITFMLTKFPNVSTLSFSGSLASAVTSYDTLQFGYAMLVLLDTTTGWPLGTQTIELAAAPETGSTMHPADVVDSPLMTYKIINH